MGEEDREEGIKHPIYDVMDAAGCFFFSNRLYKKMDTFNIKGMQFFPAVFIDDDKHFHEQYFLTNFYEKLGCLDVDESTIRSQRERSGKPLYSVEKIRLSSNFLDEIPEEHRLIFKIDNVFDAHIIVHQRIKDIIEKENATGAKFFRVDEYTEGDEYRTQR